MANVIISAEIVRDTNRGKHHPDAASFDLIGSAATGFLPILSNLTTRLISAWSTPAFAEIRKALPPRKETARVVSVPKVCGLG